MRISPLYKTLLVLAWAEGIKMNRILLINIVIYITIEMIDRYLRDLFIPIKIRFYANENR